MSKNLITIILFICYNTIFSQSTKHINIYLIDSIESKKYSFITKTGKESKSLPIKYKNNKLKIKFKYYTIYPYLNILYKSDTKEVYSIDLILNNRAKSTINIKNSFSSQINFENYIYSDASCIQNDTIMKNLFGYFRDEISDVMNFMSINNNLFNSDSLLSLFRPLVITVHNKQLSYISKYSNNYNIFWYFNNFVLTNLELCRSNDANDYKNLLIYFNKYFPSNFKNSEEGKLFVNKINSKIDLINSNKFIFNSK